MISKILQSVGNLPAFPAAVTKVLDLLSREDCSMVEVAEMISLDQSITANILKIGNSAYFKFGKSIKTVREAVIYLGKENLIRAVQIAGISKFYKITGKGYVSVAADLWEHSVAVALMSQILCRKIYGSENNVLYTAALLHDVGKIIMGTYVHESREKIYDLVNRRQFSFLEAEEAVLGINHAELGGKISKYWNLPGDICDMISFHHHPEVMEGNSVDMQWIVYLSDQLCLTMGMGNGIDGLAYRGLGEVMKRFKLREKDLEANMVTMLGDLRSARSLLEIV